MTQDYSWCYPTRSRKSSDFREVLGIANNVKKIQLRRTSSLDKETQRLQPQEVKTADQMQDRILRSPTGTSMYCQGKKGGKKTNPKMAKRDSCGRGSKVKEFSLLSYGELVDVNKNMEIIHKYLNGNTQLSQETEWQKKTNTVLSW